MRSSYRRVSGLRYLLWVGLAAMVIPLLSIAPYLTSGTELARLRNALIFNASAPQNFDWTPETQPADFLIDNVPPDPYFVTVVSRLKLEALPNDWERARAITSHLLASQGGLVGGAVQTNLVGTYTAIVESGRGYCADFVLVFRALAGAAGIPVRAWAFSLDGFGGHGHVWPEIWDRQAKRWILLDVYNNNYFVRSTDPRPLSALELRQVLLQSSGALQFRRVDPTKPPGYIYEDRALDYYRRGLPEWYLWWGSNPFSYEGGAPYRWLLPVSRSLAQLTAISAGVQPTIHPYVTAENLPKVGQMRTLRWHLYLAAFSFLAGAFFASVATFGAFRTGATKMVPVSLRGC